MGQRAEEALAQARAVAPLAGRRGDETLLLAKAQGCRVYDADNVVYLDVLGGVNALLGHGNQYVQDAVRRSLVLGLGTAFHSTAEVELVELLHEFAPAYSPWVVTPSELTAWELALRWCRRDTGRSRIIVFDGNRRGAVEPFQVTPAGPQGMSQPIVAGIPSDLARLVRVVPWGKAEAFETVLAEVGVDTAAVVLDPIASQFGVVPPEPEFLHHVQDRTRAAGARLLLDETLAGFRLARGGAAELFGLTPDLAVFGGVLGGGISHLGAVAFAAGLEATIGDELPPAPQPVAVIAAVATLSVLRNDAVLQRLEERGAQLQSGVEALAERFGRPLRCARMGSIFACYFSRSPVLDGSSFSRVDGETWLRFARLLRENGVLMPLRSPAACFLTHAHSVKDVEQLLSAMEQALKRMQREDEA